MPRPPGRVRPVARDPTVDPLATGSGGPVSARRESAATAFLAHRLAVLGLAIIVLLVLFSFVGPHLYHTNQTQVDPVLANEAPSGAHLLGTDGEGFDVLGRLMVAGQASIEIGLAAGLGATCFGALYGAAAAVAAGATDTVMMRLVDALYSVPTLFLLIILSAIYSPSVPLMIVVLAGISWLGPARLVRGEALSLRTREYVEAVRVAGGGRGRIVLRHVLPNTVGTIMVSASLRVADAILVLAAMSYLGLGLADTVPTWGGMLTNGTQVIYDGYWWQLYPAGAAIVLTILAFNCIGDGLREVLDVRL